jgi:hypothetical protein
MTTKRLLGVAAMAVTVLVLGGVGASRADHHSKHFEDCAKVCADCQVECEKNFHHCFKMVEAGKKEHAKAAHLSADCAEFCTLSAKLTARKSELAVPACEACAKACDACAAECEKFKDMPEMKACAEACKKCAASCREMVKMVGHDHGHEKK